MTETKHIPLTNGGFALCDAEDYDRLMQYKWFRSKRGYALCRRPGRTSGEGMHRMLLLPPKGMIPDHINGDRLDNRRCNLRLVTPLQNAQNRGKNARTTSMYKGVCWKVENNKWQARIRVSGKQYHIGLYDTELEAAIAYNNAARLHHGEYARLNVLPLNEIPDTVDGVKPKDASPSRSAGEPLGCPGGGHSPAPEAEVTGSDPRNPRMGVASASSDSESGSPGLLRLDELERKERLVRQASATDKPEDAAVIAANVYMWLTGAVDTVAIRAALREYDRIRSYHQPEDSESGDACPDEGCPHYGKATKCEPKPGRCIATVPTEQPDEQPLHVISSTGCSICGTDALHCSFWKTYPKPEREAAQPDDCGLAVDAFKTVRSCVETYLPERLARGLEDRLNRIEESLSKPKRESVYLSRLKDIQDYAGHYIGCRCAKDDCSPGDCWPCRMMLICEMAFPAAEEDARRKSPEVKP